MVIVMGNQTEMISSTLDPNEPGVWRVRAAFPKGRSAPRTASCLSPWHGAMCLAASDGTERCR